MIWLWLGFTALVVLLLVLDLGVFHRHAHEVSIREAGFWTAIWITLGLSFSGIVYLIYDQHWFGATLGSGAHGAPQNASDAALSYVTGYVLEKSLSVDNIFVISMIFRSFRVEPRYRHRVLFWGIIGAIVLRATMILGGAWLASRFSWIFYIFGVYLAYTGLKLLREDDEMDPEKSAFIRIARRLLPVARQDHGVHLVAREDARWKVTRLGLVLVAVEGTDVIFALDSIPAILAITTDSFIVFTSNIFAILGLRSLYFILEGMMGRFRHLKVALAFVLMFIGAKMLLHSVYQLDNFVSLGVILGSVSVGVLSSLLLEKKSTTPDP